MYSISLSSAKSSIKLSASLKNKLGNTVARSRPSGKPSNGFINYPADDKPESAKRVCDEKDRNLARSPVPVLRQDNVSDVLLIGIRLIQLFPMNEHHDIGILLD